MNYGSIKYNLGFLPGRQGLHGGGPGRHRQHPRRRPGRLHPGLPRGLGLGLHPQRRAMARRDRLHDSDHRPAGSPSGHPRARRWRRKCLMSRFFAGAGPWIVLALAAALPPARPRPLEPVYLVRVGGVIGLFMLLGLGLNFTLGYVGLFDLGFIAFYAVGRLRRRPSRCARLPSPRWPSSGGRWSPRGARAPRGDHPPPARGLPGGRHDGLRRDRAPDHQQPRRPHQRAQRACRWRPWRPLGAPLENVQYYLR